MKIEPNNIYLGDCYELIKEMPDKSVDLILTDPPYDIQGIYGSGILKTRGHAPSFHKELAENKLDKGIDLKILDDFVRVMKKINIYIWCNKEQIYDYMTYFVKERKCSFEILVWCKENPIPFCGTHYLCDKEYCLYFWEQGAPVHIPFERARTYYISKTNTTDKKDYGHPTCKLVDLLETLIKNSTGGGYGMPLITDKEKSVLRIRKLTPKECLRLMGFTDEDYQAMRDIGMSDSAIYHCAGDSIIVPCLVALFNPFVNEEHKHIDIINEYVEKEIVKQ